MRLPLREEVPEADPLTSLAINALRLTLHPKGLASRVLNLAQWRENLLSRLRREWEAGRDPVLGELYSELRSYSTPTRADLSAPPDPTALALPFRLSSEFGDLEFLSTTTVFGTSVEVFLSELVIESFFPANLATKEALQQLARAQANPS